MAYCASQIKVSSVFFVYFYLGLVCCTYCYVLMAVVPELDRIFKRNSLSSVIF